MKTEVEVALEEAQKAAADALQFGNGFIMWDICTMQARHIPWQDVQKLVPETVPGGSQPIVDNSPSQVKGSENAEG